MKQTSQNGKHQASTQPGTLTIVFVCYALFLICELIAPYFHYLLGQLLEIKNEYTMNEQLTKYSVFIIMLISAYAYETLKDPAKLQISIGFLAFGVTLYCAESNMISGTTQPVFGLIYLVYILPLLINEKAWLVLVLQGLGFGFMGVGFFGDFVIKHQDFFSAKAPILVTILGDRRDELYETIGLVTFSLSVLLFFLEPLRNLVMNNKLGILLLLLSASLITSGNSFLHYSYHPKAGLVLVGVMLSIIGVLGLAMSHYYINVREVLFPPLISSAFSGLLVFMLFIILPMIHGTHHPHIVSLFVWLPFILLFAMTLFRHKHLTRL